MKVERPRFTSGGRVYCADCPLDRDGGCYTEETQWKDRGCPDALNYAEACRIAEGRAEEEKPEAAAHLAAEMTLRDHFAAVVLNALLTWSNACDISPESHAVAAYGLADAMMKERAK